MKSKTQKSGTLVTQLTKAWHLNVAFRSFLTLATTLFPLLLTPLLVNATTILSPHSYDKWPSGSRLIVEWDSPLSNPTIELLCDGYITWHPLQTVHVVNDRKATGLVKEPAGTGCKIRVSGDIVSTSGTAGSTPATIISVESGVFQITDSGLVLDNEPLNEKTPLVLIHGWCGDQDTWQSFSNYFNQDNALTSRFKLYNFTYATGLDAAPGLEGPTALVQFLAGCGDDNTNHTKERVIGLAEELKRQIDERFGLGQNLIFVTHSLGGLIARSYMQELGGYHRTLRLITLATPHHGTLIANLVDAGQSLSGLYWDMYDGNIEPTTDWIRCLNGYESSGCNVAQGDERRDSRHSTFQKTVVIGTIRDDGADDDYVVPIDSALFLGTPEATLIPRRYGGVDCPGLTTPEHIEIHEINCEVNEWSGDPRAIHDRGKPLNPPLTKGLIKVFDVIRSELVVVSPPNQLPNGTIDSPASDMTVVAGTSVIFLGTGTDPDNNLPLTYSWNFGGGAPNSTAEDPGLVAFNTPGVYDVTFTVTDSLGLSDPTPATRKITVNAPPPPTLGTIEVRATIDGSPWSGPISYNLNGPSNINGSSVPATFSDKPTGSYTTAFVSGGPTGATHSGISPAATQVLNSGGSVTFTLNFTALCKLDVGPLTLNFGDVQVGTSADAVFAVQNRVDGPTTTVNVSTTTPFSITSPASFTVGPGQGPLVSVQFNPTTAGQVSTPISITAPNCNFTVTATGNGTGGTPSPELTVASLSLNPASLTAGNSSTGTVTLNGPAPAGGFVVQLNSSHTAVQMPSTLTVPQGATQANFTAATSTVTSDVNATVAANPGNKTATLSVWPPNPEHNLRITSQAKGTPNPVESRGIVNVSVAAEDSLGHSVSYAWVADCPALGSNGIFNDAGLPNPTWMAPANTTGQNQTCAIKVTASSDGGRLFDFSRYDQVVETPFLDTTPPAAVGDLLAGPVTPFTIALSWTTPGDDGNTETARRYDIRYSTSPVTEDNWNAATITIGKPSPPPPGSHQTFVVKGLSCETTYYFALKTLDDVDNTAISNQAVATTAPCLVNPPSTKIAFSSNRNSDYDILVMNADGTDPVNLTDHPATDVQPAWSPDGSRIAFTSNRDGSNQIWVMDADGSNPIQLTNDPAGASQPSWSPDGTKIAYVLGDGGEIYVIDIDGTNPTRLTNNTWSDYDPSWSPDGTKILFRSKNNDNRCCSLWVMDADGNNPHQLKPGDDGGAAWSPDGTMIAFHNPERDIFVMNADGTDPVKVTSSVGATDPSWSPDGAKIAFVSNRSGNDEICVANADGTNQTCITNHPATDQDPAWSPFPPNQPPSANAGPDQNITLPASASLIGSVTDDGLPSGALSITWTKVSGPGIVTFANAASASTTASFSQSGTYVLRLTAHDGQLSSSDDVTVIVKDPVPADLIVSSLSVPSQSGAGLTISVKDTTKNQGTGAAVASATKFYLSTNSTWDSGDVLLGSRTVPALAAGSSNSATTQVTIPVGTATGTYYIIAKADADGGVFETNEGNNTRSRSIRIGPDLIVSSVSAPSITGAGLQISVTDSTKNQGGGSAGASATKFYLSTNSSFGSSDILLGSRAVGTLAPGETKSGSTPLTIPPGTATGTYYIIGRADADNAVPETSETNNTKSGSSIKIGPDLIVSSVSVPSSAGAGSTISVTDGTKNQGGGSVGASTTKFYLSTNSSLGSSDILLGSRAVPGVGPGTTNSGSTLLTIPAGTASGTYRIVAQADGDNVIPETSNSNNTKASNSITIGP